MKSSAMCGVVVGSVLAMAGALALHHSRLVEHDHHFHEAIHNQERIIEALLLLSERLKSIESRLPIK
jgi:hypothetical protein